MYYMKIILIIICIKNSNELQAGKKSKLEPVTEIIMENGDMEFSTEFNSFENETLYDLIENVTESGMNDEDITEMLNVTTTTISPTTLFPDTDSKSLINQFYHHESKICQCDLTKESCDVNCCCDADCDESDKNIFTECGKEILFESSPNLEYCYSNNLLYKENSPWLIDKKPNSLFCAMKDNLPPILKSDYYKTYKSVKEFDKVANEHFGWSDVKLIMDKSFDMTKTYKYSDDVWIINNTSLQIFKISSSGINAYCSQSKTIKYMMNEKAFCTRKFNESKIIEIFNNYENMYLISSPVAMNETWIPNLKECPANVCIPFVTYVCDLQNCNYLNKSEFELNSLDILTSVKYELYSNGSNGYVKANIYFGIRKLEFFPKYIEEHYDVKHIWIPKNSSKHVQPLSGNPDYFYGMPIICSKITQTKIVNTTEIKETFDFFVSESSYALKNVLYFPKNIGGACILSNITYNTIKFNENIRANCKIFHKINITPDVTINTTNICIDIQNQIFNIISHKSENVSKAYVSIVGNPSESYKDWIEIVIDKTAYIISGSLEHNDTLVCNNLVTSYLYHFVYANVDRPDLKIKTVKLLGAKIKHEIIDSVRLKIVDDSVSLPVYVKSMFYDVTVPQNVEYAKGPQFHIYLPNDFFYPFTHNSCSAIWKNIIFNELIFVIIFLRKYFSEI